MAVNPYWAKTIRLALTILSYPFCSVLALTSEEFAMGDIIGVGLRLIIANTINLKEEVSLWKQTKAIKVDSITR